MTMYYPELTVNQEHEDNQCPENPVHRGVEMRNYLASTGDIHCAVCGAYVRMFDAS